MISCRKNHCDRQCEERCYFKSQADIELEEWWASRQEARAVAAKEEAAERAKNYYAERAEEAKAWAQKPLVERLRDVLDDHEWDMPQRDIDTLKEAIEALKEWGIVGAAA